MGTEIWPLHEENTSPRELGCCLLPCEQQTFLGEEWERAPAPRDIGVLFSLTAVVHSGKCMFNSFTIYGVMRTMNVSEGIIASRQGCWRVQVGWHLDFESGLAGIGSGGPTMAPITKLWGTGRGFKVTPCCPAELQQPLRGSGWIPAPLDPSGPSYRAPSEGCACGSCFSNPCLQGNFAALQICVPGKPALHPPPSRIFSLLGPGCVCQTLLLLGVWRGG